MTMLKPHTGDIPLVAPDALSTPFWDACTRGELIYQYFLHSGHAQFSPAPLDRTSGDTDFEWRVSRGYGTVYSWSCVWRAQTPAFEVPYVVAIVELDEGYRMVSNIIGCEPGDIHVGMSVAAEFHPVDDGRFLPYFAPRRLSPAQ